MKQRICIFRNIKEGIFHKHQDRNKNLFLSVRDIFLVISISFDKTHFTCIWVNLSRFKMIITNDYIEDMKITQELLKKSTICRSRYLLNRNSICWDSLKLGTCLNLLSLRDSDYNQQRFYSKMLFAYGFV